MTLELTRPRASSIWVTLARMAAGAAIGAASTWAYLTYARELHWADIVALMLAMVCAIGAVRLFGESFNRRVLAQMMSVEGESSEKESRQARMQAVMMAVLAVGLMWPPLATLSGAPAPLWSYAIVAASLIANVWFTWRVYTQSDEYTRHRMLDVTFRGTLIGQAVLIAYAGGERLGLVPPVTAWEVVVVLTALSIAAPLLGAPKPKA